MSRRGPNSLQRHRARIRPAVLVGVLLLTLVHIAGCLDSGLVGTQGGQGCWPVPEQCGDAVDNDCDGEVDEPACDPVPRCVTPASSPDIDGACSIRQSGIVSLAGNTRTVCARHRDGGVFCWGNNIQGALGVGDEWLELSTTPRDVITGTEVLDIGSGTMACVLRSGRSRCWGRQPLGGGAPGDYQNVALSPFSPPQAQSVDDVVQMAVGSDYQLLRTADGSLWGWGFDGGGSEALGDGDVVSTLAPAAVRALIDDVVDVDTQLRSVCAVRGDGTVWCWGAGQRGIVGPPGDASHYESAPVRIAGVEGALSVAVGASHACALLCTGEVSCWGADGFRGDGTTSGAGAAYTTAGAVIPGFTGVYRLEAAEWGTCAFRGDGELWCWGSHNFAATPQYATPQRISDIGPVADVVIGELPGILPSNGRYVGDMCVLEACGRVRCWGRNRDGQVGDGTPAERQSPVDVIGLP